MSEGRNASRYRKTSDFVVTHHKVEGGGIRWRSREERTVAGQGGQDGVDVLDRVVGVRGDSEVAVAVRGDDPVFPQLSDQSGCVRGGDADERAALLGLAGG